ncbi:hypothetical protein [Leucobacter sp. M11]|uniref:hypothetical protein n=1 Tax=Leucobacter sp. M11 TaxID=2993565 RepID=UPI002D7E6147|nr:hypothetical protein [Leucobacter sp. M11]MEB4615576.1 hypothetical protein [Leucobacter sp. M11]
MSESDVARSGRRLRTRWDRIRIWLAGGSLLALGIGVTAAAYLDRATLALEPLRGLFDLAFIDERGEIQQGNPEVYEVSTAENGPVGEQGSDQAHRFEVQIQNVSQAPSGPVSLTAKTLLPPPPPDSDGVSRDPFTVLLVSVWDEDGTLLADGVAAAELALEFSGWLPGEGRTLRVELVYRSNLGTPYYYGKDLRFGLAFSGAAR